jgi:riboflavin kinase / FMN adenylyltransferase
VVPPVEVDGAIVSSSRVRTLIAAGQVDEAAKLLGTPYRIRGMVTHGAGRGAKIGFPTANLAAIETLLPAQGVYAGRACAEGQSWPTAMNLGPSPTFDDQQVRIEAHLIGRSEPLYGQPLEVDFLARLRDIRPFPSTEALTTQLADDVRQAKQIAIDHRTK